MWGAGAAQRCRPWLALCQERQDITEAQTRCPRPGLELFWKEEETEVMANRKNRCKGQEAWPAGIP